MEAFCETPYEADLSDAETEDCTQLRETLEKMMAAEMRDVAVNDVDQDFPSSRLKPCLQESPNDKVLRWLRNEDLLMLPEGLLNSKLDSTFIPQSIKQEPTCDGKVWTDDLDSCQKKLDGIVEELLIQLKPCSFGPVLTREGVKKEGVEDIPMQVKPEPKDSPPPCQSRYDVEHYFYRCYNLKKFDIIIPRKEIKRAERARRKQLDGHIYKSRRTSGLKMIFRKIK